MERIGSIELRALTWNRDEQQLHLPDDLALEQWAAFCVHGIALRGENYFSHQLLYLSQICWNSLQQDTLQMFYIYKNALEDDILRHIFRDRWGKWLHDLLITAVATSNIELVEADLGIHLFYTLQHMQALLNQSKSQQNIDYNVPFDYTPEQLALEGPCGEYAFRLPPKPKSLLALGIEMHNCVGGYITSVLSGRSFIVRMARGDKGVGCIEISKDTIVQAYGPCNAGFAEPERQAILAWCSAHGLKPEAYTLAEPRKKPAAPPAPAVLPQIAATLEAVTATPQNFLQRVQKAVGSIFHKAF